MGKVKQEVAHDYFNLSDNLMGLNHKAYNALPKCKAKAANYYVWNECSFLLRHRMMAYIDKLIEQQANVLEFRAESRLNKSTLEKEVSDYILQRLQEQGKSRVSIWIYANRSLGVYRIEIS